MTWKRDFSCNNITCKNYKVRIDADTENNFCESCAAEIEKLGLCLSCGVEKAGTGDSVLFPWLCEKCEATAKAEFFDPHLNDANNKRRPVQQRYESAIAQLPRPKMTFWVIIFLLALLYGLGTDGSLGTFLIILTTLFVFWLPISIMYRRMRDRRAR